MALEQEWQPLVADVCLQDVAQKVELSSPFNCHLKITRTTRLNHKSSPFFIKIYEKKIPTKNKKRNRFCICK